MLVENILNNYYAGKSSLYINLDEYNSSVKHLSRALDGVSDPIYIKDGLLFGNSRQTVAYVSCYMLE